LGGDVLCSLLGLAVGLDSGFTDRLGLGQRSIICLDRLLLGEKEVAGVAIGHIHHITPLPESVDVVGEDQLHRPPT
jgi:hypothetical protein